MKRRFIILILMAVISASFYIGVTQIQASEVNDFGTLFSKQDLSILTDHDYTLSRYKNGLDNVWILSKIGLWKNLNLSLSGFEDSVETCRQKIYQVGDVSLLCLKGDVGVHAQNLIMIDLIQFQPVSFQNDDGKYYSLISDVPFFYTENESLAILIADMRNYDKNPLADSIRNYYQWSGNGFIFDKQENITYDGKNTITEGAL
ncbi:MAG TPA: hypothetical protein VJK08_02285 [Patescibacteria group bacterium]|nr:hypothetical protein [Patescibacteria group bacterium]